MIKEITQDIFQSEVDIIIHGINCFCAQYSGIAGIIRKYFPEVAEDDINFGRKGDKTKLGEIIVTRVNNPNFKVRHIISIFQQYNYGTDTRKLDYEAIYSGLLKIRQRITNNNLVIGIPWGIGCGLAGGDWNIIKTMIYSVFENSPFTVLICKLPDKKKVENEKIDHAYEYVYGIKEIPRY